MKRLNTIKLFLKSYISSRHPFGISIFLPILILLPDPDYFFMILFLSLILLYQGLNNQYGLAKAYQTKPLDHDTDKISIRSFSCDDNSNRNNDSSQQNIYSHCDIDIVLPCYNPSSDWVDVIVKQFTYLQVVCPNHNFHLIVSNDGSTINCGQEQISRLKKAIPGVVFIDYHTNMGKGMALRRGVAVTTSPLVIYTDIDFPYQCECMSRLVHRLESGKYDIVISKRNQTYHSELSPVRRMLSWSSRIMNDKILGMRYSDTQGGLKGFNSLGRELFLQTKIERFLFDTEFIYKASRKKDIRINQITVNLRDNIHLPAMGFKTMRREFINFLRILLSR